MSRCSPVPSPSLVATSSSIASLHRRDRAAQALELGLDILGDDLADQQRGSCSTAEPDRQPGVEPHAFEPDRQQPAARLSAISSGLTSSPLATSSATIIAIVCSISISSSVVVARRAVLHDQHAEHPAAAQDRHAHQRVIDLLAGLRPVGEIGVRLRIGKRQRPRGRGDDADQALADAQPGAMHRLGTQALGGEQLEHLAGAHDIGRAHLGDHLGGDDAHDPVEPLLRACRTPP